MSSPIQINLNVQLEAHGELQIFSSAPEIVLNPVEADFTLPVSTLYKPAVGEVAESGLIEFFEPSDALGDKAAVYGADKATFASLLASGLQAVLVGEMDAKDAEPFKESRYAGVAEYRTHEHFGRLALAAYADHIFGHQAATAAITNDEVFMDGILSRNETGTWLGIGTDDLTASAAIAGLTENAKLAVRLAQAIVTKPVSDMTQAAGSRNTVSEAATKKDILANIVRQVIGQDASRAMGQDNNQLAPDVKQPLRFIVGDTIVVNIKLTTPDVKVGDGQKVTDTSLEAKVAAAEETSYSIIIKLAETGAVGAFAE